MTQPSEQNSSRPKSSMVQLKRNKSAQRKYIPEEYFKKCGYRYDQVSDSAFIQKNLHKLVKTQHADPFKDGTSRRFNEELELRPKETRSTITSQSCANLKKALKKDNLDKLSQSRQTAQGDMKSAKSHMLAMSSQKLKTQHRFSKKESSIRTEQLLSKLREFNQIQERIKKLESNLRAKNVQVVPTTLEPVEKTIEALEAEVNNNFDTIEPGATATIQQDPVVLDEEPQPVADQLIEEVALSQASSKVSNRSMAIINQLMAELE